MSKPVALRIGDRVKVVGPSITGIRDQIGKIRTIHGYWLNDCWQIESGITERGNIYKRTSLRKMP